MNRLDRALGILMLLRGGKAISAGTLARRFEVSERTIYRDVETLSALGVPVYAERGRRGGFRLLEGYFLPPVTFEEDEALALLIGLALLGSLRSKPFSRSLRTATEKLIAAVPERLHPTLDNIERHIGFEAMQSDIFHPEPPDPERPSSSDHPLAAEERREAENQIVSSFVQGVVSRGIVALRYRSPYRPEVEDATVEPLGAFWDRGYWYLVGRPVASGERPRLWRADRVLELRTRGPREREPDHFDVREYLGRRWLAAAMARWADETPVRIRLTLGQAERLRGDWYFRQARFELLPENQIVMTFGETSQETVFELLRWLGPGAELIEPAAWRPLAAAQLSEMLATYQHTAAT